MRHFQQQATIGAFATPADPWEGRALDFEWRDNWLLGYIDILTLFITLLVVLLALGNQTTASDEQAVSESPVVQTQQVLLNRPILTPPLSGQATADSAAANPVSKEALQVTETSTLSVMDVEVSWGDFEETSQPQPSIKITSLALNQAQGQGFRQSKPQRPELTVLAQTEQESGKLTPRKPATQESVLKPSGLAVDIAEASFEEPSVTAEETQSEFPLVADFQSQPQLQSQVPPLPQAPSQPQPLVDSDSVESLVEEAAVEFPSPSSAFERMVKQLAAEGLDKRVNVKPLAQGALLELQDNILFPLGSAELKQEGLYLLEDLLKILMDKGGRVSVEGHSDNQPIFSSRYPSNWELSSSRATQVARYLISGGYDPAKLRVVGYADTQPVASNETSEGRAQNRRVSLVVEFLEKI
ncbi:OmpA family protein [Motiliproteus sp. MSK22-1]|uniref:OmpA family protein n=1 Tax=Motiliproteus sp. MSK22-1 TaxID=1897630 RepID=UPI0009755F03|nr:OmpA family protein [Motiliproteus sp. MSK22-1]OMH26599.1 hypothetical protein BGP75_23155 [Motiliproteus sp. MSK22-1]